MGDDAGAVAVTGFVGVLRRREFRVLWLADIQSLLGDQIARVALAVLVFDRTQSGLATAAVYALTFLPALLGGVVLGAVADRLPRRALLVAGDAARAVLLTVMAVAHLPLTVLAALLIVAVLIGAPWKAAETALVIDILPAREHPVGLGLRSATTQGAQLAGFAVGGVTVAALGPHTALAVDAVTFLVSAALIRTGIRHHPAIPHHDGTDPATRSRRRWWGGLGVVAADTRLRQLLALSWLLGLLVVPEGLAAPYAAEIGGGARSVGLLLSAGPAGVLIGTVLYSRFLPDTTRAALLGPFAAAAGLPLLVCAAQPGLVLTCLLWALSGACTCYQVQVVTEFVALIDPRHRAQGIALASAGLLGAQGIGVFAGGVLTQLTTPASAVAAAGAAATLLGAALAATRQRTLHRDTTTPQQTGTGNT